MRTFATTTPLLLDLSAWLDEHACTHVAMEATGIYWRPVWQVLDADSRTLILANAAHVKNVPGRKTDVADAVWLSDLLAHGLIRASFVPEAQTQAMRDLLRTRKQMVREQASHVQRIQRPSRRPTSSSPRCSPTSWASPAAPCSTRWSRASAIRLGCRRWSARGEGGAPRRSGPR